MTLTEISSEGVTLLKNIDISREYITTSQAARRSGLSPVYLTQLLRKGTLEGFQLAREWFLYTDSLERFLATPRKPGPKGPRNKSSRKQFDAAPTNSRDAAETGQGG